MIQDFLDVKIRRLMYPGVSITRSAVVVTYILIIEDERAAFVRTSKTLYPASRRDIPLAQILKL